MKLTKADIGKKFCSKMWNDSTSYFELLAISSKNEIIGEVFTPTNSTIGIFQLDYLDWNPYEEPKEKCKLSTIQDFSKTNPFYSDDCVPSVDFMKARNETLSKKLKIEEIKNRARAQAKEDFEELKASLPKFSSLQKEKKECKHYNHGFYRYEYEVNMTEDQILKLEKIKSNMEASTKFAEKLPVFSDKIINYMFVENDEFIDFGDQYKNLYLAWGIKRGRYVSGTNRTVTNYHEKYDEFLFSIYINSINLFDSNNDYNLLDVVENTPLFFYDHLNHTFYAKDSQIEALLEALNVWYLNAKKENQVVFLKEKIKKAQLEIDRATASLSELTMKAEECLNIE